MILDEVYTLPAKTKCRVLFELSIEQGLTLGISESFFARCFNLDKTGPAIATE